VVISHQHDESTIITLLPNRSASWAETRVFVLVLCATTLIIGLFWTVIGAWMVLPFSGLEAAMVAYLMYRVCQSTYQRQVITCSPSQVLVQFGSQFPKRSWTLPRHGSHLSVTEGRHPLDPRVLKLVDGSHNIELGSFLNREDKEQALTLFKSAGLYTRHNNPAGSSQI